MAIVSFGRIIPTGRVRRLIRNYKSKKWNRLSSDLGQEESKSVYFDEEFCKTLIDELQKPDINGMRVYFGAYEEDHPNIKRKGKMTVIFITTKDGSNQLIKPDDPECGWLDYEKDDTLKISEMNDGALCPPLGCEPKPENELWPNN